MLGTNQLRICKGASQSIDPVVAAKELYESIGQANMSFSLFYCSSDYNLEALGTELKKRFGDANLVGCTSAGEITPVGYTKGTLTGVSIASPNFTVVTHALPELAKATFDEIESVPTKLKADLARNGSDATGDNTFGFLLIDGLSGQEEAFVAALNRSMGDMELFGGSAADGINFKKTFIYYDGRFHTDAALFSLIQTTLPFRVFKTQHFVSTDKKMVVTKADAANRLVTEINGEPAGREYARMVGLEVDRLEPTIFAAHPVVVKIGGNIYVRSIMKVNEDESLSFACAIDEGIVLSVAQGTDLVRDLEVTFDNLRKQIGKPQLVLGCDCLFRMLEMEQRGIKDAVGKILTDNNTIGFSTYGEQYNGMHVNQTFTGVAIGSE